MAQVGDTKGKHCTDVNLFNTYGAVSSKITILGSYFSFQIFSFSVNPSIEWSLRILKYY